MNIKVKDLTERDFKKKMQTVYTFTPGDLRFLLVHAGIKKENIKMAHVNRDGHEWLSVIIETDSGCISCPFDMYGYEEDEE